MQGLLSSERLGNSSLWGLAGSAIKSIQRGQYSANSYTNNCFNDYNLLPVSSNVSIAPINVNKSIVMPAESNFPTLSAMIEIINSTTINIKVNNESASVSYPMVGWTVIEFDNVKSVQRGYDTNSYHTPIAISKVNPSKSILICQLGTDDTTITINPTSIQKSRSYALYWQLVEFN